MAVLEAAVRSAESGMVQTTGPVRRRAQHAALIALFSGYLRPAGNRYFAPHEKSLSIRRLTLLYPAPWRKAPLEISANWEEDRMQIDRNEKGLLTLWTRQPYYGQEAHVLLVRRYHFSILSLSVQILRRPREGGNVMTKN